MYGVVNDETLIIDEKQCIPDEILALIFSRIPWYISRHEIDLLSIIKSVKTGEFFSPHCEFGSTWSSILRVNKRWNQVASRSFVFTLNNMHELLNRYDDVHIHYICQKFAGFKKIIADPCNFSDRYTWERCRRILWGDCILLSLPTLPPFSYHWTIPVFERPPQMTEPVRKKAIDILLNRFNAKLYYSSFPVSEGLDVIPYFGTKPGKYEKKTWQPHEIMIHREQRRLRNRPPLPQKTIHDKKQKWPLGGSSCHYQRTKN